MPETKHNKKQTSPFSRPILRWILANIFRHSGVFCSQDTLWPETLKFALATFVMEGFGLT